MDDSATPAQGDEQKLANLEQELKTVTPPPSPTPAVPESVVPPTPPVVPPAPAVPATPPPPILETSETSKKNPILWIAVFILFLAIIAAGVYFLIQSRLVNVSQPTPLPVETLGPVFEETMPPVPESTESASPSALPSSSPSASPSASPTSTATPSAMP